jgi:hypothetical protein
VSKSKIAADGLRERLAERVAHLRHPWTRSTKDPILSSPDYASCFAEADIYAAEVAEWLLAQAAKLARQAEADDTFTPQLQADALTALAHAVLITLPTPEED